MSYAPLIDEANRVLFVERKLDEVETYFTTDYVCHLTGKDVRGLDLVRRAIGMVHRAFTDMTVEVEVLVQMDGRVAWLRTFHATHSAAYAGFPGTGKALRWRDMVTSSIEGGRITQEWVVSDLAEQLLKARKN